MHSPIPAKVLTIVTLCLCPCAAAQAQAPARGEWLLLPQLARGQEFAYSGWFTEETTHAGVQRQQAYRLESTVLVLDGNAAKWDVAFLTVLTLRDPKAAAGTTPPASVRLERAEVNKQGRLKAGASALPLGGPPTAEFGALVEAPRSMVAAQQFWEVSEPGRPPRTWRVAGTEVIQSTVCVKLLGQQQSDDWDRPRADRTAWRRHDTVWLAPQPGIAFKVERVLERRDPARTEPTYRSVLRYELDSRLSYPGKLFEDCLFEVERARKFQEEAEPLLRQPNLYRAQLDALLKRVALHLQQPPPAGHYRKAVVQLQRRLEAARRGEVIPEPGAAEPAATAGAGQRVPDFVVTELVNRQSVRLYRLLGRPVVLLFYNPATETGKQALRAGQALSDRHRAGLTVLALAVTHDEDLVRRQHKEMKLTLPILDGNGLHQTFGVDATPRVVVIDGEGVLRAGFTGWGAHTGREVQDEVQRWLPK